MDLRTIIHLIGDFAILKVAYDFYRYANPTTVEPTERITCAAVWFNDGNVHAQQTVATGFVVAGHRHHNCYRTAALLSDDKEKLRMIETVDGFLVSGAKGRFVDRKEALIIATAAGQIGWCEKHNPLDELDSSDLY